jgi:hypothetical protein
MPEEGRAEPESGTEPAGPDATLGPHTLGTRSMFALTDNDWSDGAVRLTRTYRTSVRRRQPSECPLSYHRDISTVASPAFTPLGYCPSLPLVVPYVGIARVRVGVYTAFGAPVIERSFPASLDAMHADAAAGQGTSGTVLPSLLLPHLQSALIGHSVAAAAAAQALSASRASTPDAAARSRSTSALRRIAPRKPSWLMQSSRAVGKALGSAAGREGKAHWKHATSNGELGAGGNGGVGSDVGAAGRAELSSPLIRVGTQGLDEDVPAPRARGDSSLAPSSVITVTALTDPRVTARQHLEMLAAGGTGLPAGALLPNSLG